MKGFSKDQNKVNQYNYNEIFGILISRKKQRKETINITTTSIKQGAND